MPFYNNEATVGVAVRSLVGQTKAVLEVLAIDDGSTDGSARVAEEAGARVVSLGSNRGRGAARARAVEEAQGDYLLSVDGAASLAPDFLERCLPWFEDKSTAAVYGKVVQLPPKSVADRWRGRHLYQLEEKHEAGPAGSLITGGVVLRRSAVLAVGNFDAGLRHSEDFELGRRLLAAGWKIVYEPSAEVTTLVSNSLMQILERYWRWYAGVTPAFRLKHYARMVWYSLKVLAVRDLRHGDFQCAAVSLFMPHYCAYRSLRK